MPLKSNVIRALLRAMPVACACVAAPAWAVESIHFGYLDNEPLMTDSLRLSTRDGTLWWSANKQRFNVEDGSPVAYSYHDGYIENSFLINGVTHTADQAAQRWHMIVTGQGDPWTGATAAQIGTPSIIILDELNSSFTDGGNGTLLRQALQIYTTTYGGSRNDIAAFFSPSFSQSTSLVKSNYDDIIYSANNYLRSVQLETYANESSYNTSGDSYLASELGAPVRNWTTTFGISASRVQPTLLVSNLSSSTAAYPAFLNREFYFLANGWYNGSHSGIDANVKTSLRNGVSSYSWTSGSGDYQLLDTVTLRDAYFEECLNWYSVLGNTSLDNFWNADANSTWGTSSNWMTGAAVGGVDSLAKFLFPITQPRTITLASATTAGHLVIANTSAYTFTGAALSLQTSTGGADVTVTAGSHTIACPMTLNSNTSFAITPAASTLTISGALTATGKVVTKSGAGTLLVNNLRATSLSVSGGTVKIADNGAAAATSRLGGITVSGGGSLDLRNNNLVVVGGTAGTWNGANYTGVAGLVQSGRNRGAWNGGGIITSMTASSAQSHLTTLAVAAAGDVGKSTFAGLSVAVSDVLVMYTYIGDADLSGGINGDDYFRIDRGYAAHASGYDNGDFNYDGRIDADDYFIIDQNYVRRGAAFTMGEPVMLGGVQAVPEPAVMGIVGMGLMSLCRRRRISKVSASSGWARMRRRISG